MRKRSLENRFLSKDEKNALRRLSQKLMTMPRHKRISKLYAWCNNEVYRHQLRDKKDIRWHAAFQRFLHHIIDTSKSSGNRDTNLLIYLVEGDVDRLQSIFGRTFIARDHCLSIMPGLRTRSPKRGFEINRHDDKIPDVIIEQFVFQFDPLIDLASDNRLF